MASAIDVGARMLDDPEHLGHRLFRKLETEPGLPWDLEPMLEYTKMVSEMGVEQFLEVRDAAKKRYEWPKGIDRLFDAMVCGAMKTHTEGTDNLRAFLESKVLGIKASLEADAASSKCGGAPDYTDTALDQSPPAASDPYGDDFSSDMDDEELAASLKAIIC